MVTILSNVPMLIQWQNIEYSGQNFNEEAQHEFPGIKQISLNRSFFFFRYKKKFTERKNHNSKSQHSFLNTITKQKCLELNEKKCMTYTPVGMFTSLS